MPDPKGNYTPADISQLSIQGLLGKRELEQGDQDQAMKALEFQRKIQHADLDAELKKLNLYFDQTRKSLLDRVLEGNFQNPTPQEKMVLRLIGIESKPEDFASPEDLKTGAKVGMGLQPSANAQLGADVDRERIGLGREELAARVRAMTVEGFNSLVAAGADPMALSQGDIGDPETIAKAFAGAVPTARMQALTNYALGVAQITHMNAQAALYEAQAKAESENTKSTSDSKKYKFAGLQAAINGFQRSAQAYNQIANNGGDTTAAERAMVLSGQIMEQEYRALGYTPPPEAQVKPGFFRKMFDYLGFKKQAPGPGEVNLEDLVDASGNIDLNRQIGASPAPGASPMTAPPAPALPIPPAAGAPNYVVPPGMQSTGPNGAPLDENGYPYAVEPIGGEDLEPEAEPPPLPISGDIYRGSEGNMRAGKLARRDALLKSVQLYLTDNTLYTRFVSELTKLPIEEQIVRLEGGLSRLRKTARR